MLAILYDIHGNVDALEAVLAEAQAAGATRWLIGGDVVAPEPLGSETLARLRALEHTTWIRGNVERWLTEPPLEYSFLPVARLMAQQLPNEIERLYDLPTYAEIDDALYVHASPLSDMRTFAPAPEEGEEELLAGATAPVVVFGHSHLQFDRPGPGGTRLINPGSVGSPRDADPRAAWALRRDDGEFELRRTSYDFARAAAAFRAAIPEPFGDEFARVLELD